MGSRSTELQLVPYPIGFRVWVPENGGIGLDISGAPPIVLPPNEVKSLRDFLNEVARDG